MNRRELLKTLPVAAGAAMTAGPVSIAMAGENVGRSLVQEAYDEMDWFCNRFAELLQNTKIHTTMKIKSRYDNPDLNLICNQIRQEKESSLSAYTQVIDYEPERGYSVSIFVTKHVNSEVRISINRNIPVPTSNVIRI